MSLFALLLPAVALAQGSPKTLEGTVSAASGATLAGVSVGHDGEGLIGEDDGTFSIALTGSDPVVLKLLGWFRCELPPTPGKVRVTMVESGFKKQKKFKPGKHCQVEWLEGGPPAE